ncbi:ATP:ADP antiporter, AAA family [Pancytospora philotis]|nr:ATP:ADP antiporter, AAA family [Pancytospora philotis]
MTDAVVESQPVADNSDPKLLTPEELKEQAKEMQKTWVGAFFPVLRSELSRFGLMAAAFFLIAFVYGFTRLYKDVVINTVLESSARSWLKLSTFFTSLIAVGLIQKLLKRHSLDTTFEIATATFGVIMFILSILIHFRAPLQKDPGWAENFFIAGTADTRGISGLYIIALIFNHWIFAVFYTIVEVIGSLMVSYLFMTYVNSHCTEDQNSRFVRLLYIGSNISGLVASRTYKAWNSRMKTATYEEKDKYYVIFSLATVLVFAMIIGIKRRLDYVFRTNPLVIKSGAATSSKKKKVSLSIIDGLYYALVSKLLLAICMMTLFYNIANTVLIGLFGNSCTAAALFNGEDRSTFMAENQSIESQITHIGTILVLISPLSSKLMEWFGVALLGSVPILVCFLGAIATAYYAVINFAALGEDNMKIFSAWNDAQRKFGAEIWCGIITSSSVKISKYAFFDIVKESISMKINPEIRPLFKGVYDGVCGKLGKCSGSVYNIFMESVTGKRDARYFAPITCLIIVTLCAFWTWAIAYLHSSFKSAKANGTYMSPDYFEGVNLKAE